MTTPQMISKVLFIEKYLGKKFKGDLYNYNQVRGFLSTYFSEVEDAYFELQSLYSEALSEYD